MNGLAVAGIGLYQQYISPYKGFRCANRALNAGWSCSEFGKRAFARYGADKAWALLKRRFERCRDAYLAIKAAKAEDAEEGRQRPSRFRAWLRRKKEDAKHNCGSCDVSPDPSGCADVGACDCSI